MSAAATDGTAAGDRSTLFHLAVHDEWHADAAGTSYVPAAFASEGFVHCSYRWQLAGVYGRYYAGRTDLVVVELDRARLVAVLGEGALVEEPSPATGEDFPHVYAPLPRVAVRAVHDVSMVTSS